MKLNVLLLRSLSSVSLLILFSLAGFAQTFPVNGKVSNTTGEALAGVTVQVKNGKAATTTQNGWHLSN